MNEPLKSVTPPHPSMGENSDPTISKKIPSVQTVVAMIDAKTYSVVKKETEENGVGELTWVIVVVNDDIGETLEGRSTRETSEETSSEDGSQLSSEDG